MARLASEQTVGVSPKVSIPSSLLALAGAAVMVLDLLGVIDIEDEIWITLLGSGGVAFGAGYAASPGVVVAPDTPAPGRSSWGSEKGLTMLEAVVLLLAVAVIGLALVIFT